MSAFVAGFILMASVIFAVGPQNALLINCGIKRQHPFLVAAIFTLCDLLLISLGVLGLGQFIAQVKPLKLTIVIAGAAFLIYFSFKAFRSAYKGGQSIAKNELPSREALIGKALAVSLLNPGAIIDTTVIVGSVSSKYSLHQAMVFGLGAQLFSSLFFFTLAGLTKTIAPLLDNPTVWRLIDLVIGFITIIIAWQLIASEF